MAWLSFIKHSAIWRKGHLWFLLVTVALLFGATPVLADSLDNWNLRNPVPPGNLLYGVTYANNSFVAVGDFGTIITSMDGITWTNQTSGTGTHLRVVTYGNNSFVAVGEFGTILTSADGITWTSGTSGTTNDLDGVTYGNNSFVAVGRYGTILTSADGITWTSRTSGTTNFLHDVTNGNNSFVAVGDGSIVTSADGITWTSRTSDTTNYLYGVTYGNNSFVAVGGDGTNETVVTSGDGITWTSRTFGTTMYFNGVTYGNNGFVAVGYNGSIVTSTDGINWTIRTSGTPNHLTAVTYGNNSFVAVGMYGTILQSDIVTPTILGRIRRPDGSAYAPGQDSWIDVCLRPSNGREYWTGVNGDGSFKYGGEVISGEYSLYAYPRGNNPYAKSAPITINVVSGQQMAQDIILTDPVMTGKVLKPDGSPFSPGPGNDWDGRVILRDNKGNEITDSKIENNGTYKLGGNTPSGQYKLCVNTWGNNNPYTNSIPLTINVTSGTVLTQDISLTNPLITGKVLNPDGSVFTPGNDSNVHVKLRRQDDSGDDICGTGLNGDGSFRLGGDIPTGDYLLMADANGSNNPYADAIPVIVDVTAGQTISQDISLTNPIILGRIRRPDGSAYAPEQDSWIDVCLRSSNGKDNWTGVNGDGSFKYGGEVTPGQYSLYAYPRGSNPYAKSAPSTINVVSGHQVAQDIILTNPVITGKVLKPDGSPFSPGPGNDWDGRVILRDNMGNEITDSKIENNGTYKLGGNTPSGQYKLYVDTWGNNNPYTNSIPLTVNVTSGTVLTQDLSLTNSLITGKVLKPDGSVFTPGNDSHVYVKIRRLDNSGEDLCGTGLNDDGSFRLGGDIPTGDYLLMADANGNNNPFANSIPVTVHITVGQLLTQDISLINPIITGTILNPDGSSFVPGQDLWIDVCLRSSNGWDNWTGVNGNGKFKYGGDIPSGEYTLFAYPRGRNNQYAKSVPITFNVVSGQQVVHDLTLTNPIIKGKVLKPDGNPYMPGNDSYGMVILRDANGNELTDSKIEGNGTYQLGGNIQPGQYTLSADIWANNPYCSPIPLTITVASGTVLTQDITLTNPLITGRVLKPDGNVFTPGNDSNVYVKLRRQDKSGDDICGTGLNDDGSFRLGGDIPTGDYLLIADANGKNNPFANSIPVTVHLTTEQSIIQDITLTIPAITGMILKPDGTNFLYHRTDDYWVNVNLFDPASQKHIYGTGVRDDGSYKISGNISNGTYWLTVNSGGSDCPYTASIPVEVQLTVGQTITRNLSLTNPMITGKVFTPDGAVFIPQDESVGDVSLWLTTDSSDKGQVMRVGINNNGSYKMGGDIKSGDYMLRAEVGGNNNPYANAIPILLHLESGTVSTQDIYFTYPGVAVTLVIKAPSNVSANNPFDITVIAEDAFGNIAAGYRGKVHFTSTDSLAELPTDFTFTSTDNGSQTFSVTLKTAGAKSITVTDMAIGMKKATSNTLPADDTFTATDNGSQTFSVPFKTVGSKSISDTVTSTLKATCNITVNPGVEAKLTMTVLSITKSNRTIAVTVKAKDDLGNTATGYRGKVHFTSSDSLAGLPEDYTFTSADNGSHTFSIIFKTAGAKSITVTDTVNSALKATSNIIVNIGEAVNLAMTAPKMAKANQTITVTVTAKDALGNTASGYRGTVQFTSSDSLAGLPTDYTFTSKDNGSHTFSIIMKTVGANNITVKDTVTSSLRAISNVMVIQVYIKIPAIEAGKLEI